MNVRLCLLAMLLLRSGAAVGQTTLRTDATLVLVPALVETTGKELATSLTAKDFVLTDNGAPQTVTLEDETRRAGRWRWWCSCRRGEWRGRSSRATRT